MPLPAKPKKCKLIFALIYSSEEIYQKAKRYITRKFGILDLESSPLEFNFTDYYNEEMGSNLKRRFISCKKLIEPDDITQIKLTSVKLERKLSILGKRRINIDPGYITEAKLVLSTTKDFSHRIYLGNKVFAEITLVYQNKGFKNLTWTFPDYRTKPYKNTLLKIRTLLKEQLKKPVFSAKTA
ncbi:MAG: DUF4416 family protein [Candidatus Omnitrophica bacterium]|nr:DUF4416 family protein [Candidatus Omnitrophota bacterium]